jgi:phage baseplate assembly protein W
MTPPFMAVEFMHPDFGKGPADPGGVPASELGLRWTPDLRLATVSEAAAIRQSLLMLLTTRPGERVMRPAYGCNLRALAFEPNDDTTAGLAMHYVRQAIARWEPRVEIVRLDVARRQTSRAQSRRGPGDEADAPISVADPDSVLTIVVEYRVLASSERDRLDVPVSLSGRDV